MKSFFWTIYIYIVDLFSWNREFITLAESSQFSYLCLMFWLQTGKSNQNVTAHISPLSKGEEYFCTACNNN